MGILNKKPQSTILDVSRSFYHEKIGDKPETTFEALKNKIEEILMKLQIDFDKEYTSEDITSEEGYNNYYQKVIDGMLSIIENSDIKSYAEYWPTVNKIFLNKPFISKEKLKIFNAYLRDQGISYQLSENSSIISELLFKDENENTHKATAPRSFLELPPVTTVFMANPVTEEDMQKSLCALFFMFIILLVLYLLPKPKPVSAREQAMQREVLMQTWTAVNGFIVVNALLKK